MDVARAAQALTVILSRRRGISVSLKKMTRHNRGRRAGRSLPRLSRRGYRPVTLVPSCASSWLSNRIVTSPWPSYQKNDYQIIVRVERFDGELGGEVVLRGLWSILDSEGQNELTREVFEFKANAADLTYQEMVAAMSQLTVQLAGQLADGVISEEAK